MLLSSRAVLGERLGEGVREGRLLAGRVDMRCVVNRGGRSSLAQKLDERLAMLSQQAARRSEHGPSVCWAAGGGGSLRG